MSNATRRAGYAVLVLLLLGGLLLPLARFGRFHGPVKRALERSLGREVEIRGPVRLHVFPRPGFSAGEVTVHETPTAGIEPFAYVDSLEADLSLGGILMGDLGIGALRLVRPRLNVVKVAPGVWNYQDLVNQPGIGSPVRTLQVQDGRLNFKFGNMKSVYYIGNTSLELSPQNSDSGVLRIRFFGEPGRTDRPARGYGRFSGTGQLLLDKEREDELRFVFRLERSAIDDLRTLLNGPLAGVSGFVSSRAELAGPLSSVRIMGELEVSGLDPGELPLAAGNWSAGYSGHLNLISQSLAVEGQSPGDSTLPWAVRFEISDYLRHPAWELEISGNGQEIPDQPEPFHLMLRGPKANGLE